MSEQTYFFILLDHPCDPMSAKNVPFIYGLLLTEGSLNTNNTQENKI